MMPPRCELCDRGFDPSDSGGLVSFARSERDNDWYRRAEEEPGFVGHPPNQVWFCGVHFDAAWQLSHLTRGEAMPLLRTHP